MVTTSLKLPDSLRARLARVARAQGISPHAFMVDAIEHQTDAAENRSAFVAAALKAERELVRSGKAYGAEEVHAYLQARSRGRQARLPTAKSWRK